MISIVIPTYNSAGTLDRALASIYRNDFKDFEVIVVDDGSNDNTREVVKRYNADYLRLKSNKGAAFARNRGSKIAKGDVLLFLDADAEIEPYLLNIVKEHFINSDYDVISGAFAKEPKINNIPLYFISTLSNYNFSRTNFAFATHIAAIRRAAFDKLGGFNEKYKGATAEDFDFFYRLIASGYKCKTDIKMTAYHNHDFTFRSLFKRMFVFGLLKTPIILRYNSNAHVVNQKRRYLVNNEYISSYILISLLPVVILSIFFIHYAIIFLILWFALYALVKSRYLASLNKKRLQMFLLSIINDSIVLSGCLIGASKYYYAKTFKKAHN